MRFMQSAISSFAIGALALSGATSSALADDEKVQSDVKQSEAAQTREQLDMMAQNQLDELLESNEQIQSQYEDAVGYAVFRATQGGFLVTGAGGTGVVVNKETNERTYMHMGSGGVALGAGLTNYHPIFLFETEAALERFVDGNWNAAATAQAAAGRVGAIARSSFFNGVAVYNRTDEGLMAQVDVSGTRFWRSEKLNTETGG